MKKETLKQQYDYSTLLKEPLTSLNILDIGCGGGLLSEVISTQI